MSAEVVVPHAHASLDAGEKRCGEMILALKGAVDGLRPGEVLQLVCNDPAAREDLPAWCRLTGHRLLWGNGQTFYIRRREV